MGPKSKVSSKAESTVKRKKLAKGSNSEEGETAEEAIAHFTKLVNKRKTFEAVTGSTRVSFHEIGNTLDLTVRQRIPFKGLVVDGKLTSMQFIQIVGLPDYTIAQAPNENNYSEIIRCLWVDSVKILVCLCDDDQISKTDNTKCYPYFPNEPDKSVTIELPKKEKGGSATEKGGSVTLTCKTKEQLSFGVIKYEMEMIGTGIPIDEKLNSDDPTNASNDGKPKTLTILHANTWNGKYTKDAFDEAHNVALLCKEILKLELVVLRASLAASYVAPVVIQSFDGIGRAAIVYAGILLAKDVEKRENFDLPDQMKRLASKRTGCFSTYFHYAFTFAVGLRIGFESKWITETECNQKVADLAKGFENRKLNEIGNPL